MAYVPNETASPGKATAPQREVLTELVRTATAMANEQLTSMVNRLVAALGDLTTAGIEAQMVYRRTRSGNLLKNNAYAFVHLAGEAIERALRAEVDGLSPRASGSVDGILLSLVPMEEMDNKVAFGTLSRPFDIEHSEILASLCVRLGMLLGRDVLRPVQNPFRPEVFLQAVNSAWREFEPDAESHDLLLPFLRLELFLDLGPLLETLDTALRQRSKQARERFHIQKSSESGVQRSRRSDMDPALAQQLRVLLGHVDPRAAGSLAAPGNAVEALIPELPNMPQGGGWRPSAATAFAGTAASPGFAAPQHGTPPGGATPYSGFAAPAPVQGATTASGFANQGIGAPGAHAAAQAPVGASMPALPEGLLGLLANPGKAQIPDGASMAAGTGAGVGAGGGAESGMAPQDALPEKVFYLPRLKQSLPKGSLSRGEENTLDLLSRIFETVLLDDSIPAETRELINFLQVPVLKAALVDQGFFFQEAHPARRMIDLLSRMGWEGRKGADDPVVQAMQRGVDRIGREADPQPAAFAEAVAELEAELAAEERAAEEAIAAPIERARKIERQTIATRSARQAVATRVADGELVTVVSSFLEKRWVNVLTFAHLIDEDRPGAVENATQVMDELVWTVKPKATAEQRKVLIAKLPGLLATLNKWLDAIKWQDAERLEFFAELARIHLSIVRAPLELAPERQLELAVEAAQQDALRRIAREQATAEQEAAERAAPPSPVDELERGMRLAFTQPDGSVRQVKLAWVSPLRTLFIFSSGLRQEAFSLPADKLAEAFRSGSVRVVALEGVVGRVLTEALQEAMNDPAPQPMKAVG